MLKLNSKEQNIWISSDLHINHVNICRGTSNWKDAFSTRNFNTINEMNEEILGNINKLVKKDDLLILLGDLLFRWKRTGDYINLFSKITCNNIYIIFGNHCRNDSLLECKEILDKIKYIGDILFCQIDDRKVYMNHYANRVWPESHHNSFHLYGHSHGSLPGLGKSMDVGIDAAFNEFNKYKPYNWKEIKSKLDKIDIYHTDYHNKNII